MFLDFWPLERLSIYCICLRDCIKMLLSSNLRWLWLMEMEFCIRMVVDWPLIWEYCLIFLLLESERPLFMLIIWRRPTYRKLIWKMLRKRETISWWKDNLEEFGELLWDLKIMLKTLFLFLLEPKSPFKLLVSWYNNAGKLFNC